MSKKKKSKKPNNSRVEIWTEEQYEEYLEEVYDMEFIAGFTEGGVPYGIFKEDKEICGINKTNNPSDTVDEIPF